MGMIGGAQGIFSGETILCGTVMMDPIERTAQSMDFG